MKKKLRGFKRQEIQLDFNLYRVDVPIRGLSNAKLSVIDLYPESVSQTIVFVHGYAGCAETWEYQINYFARDYRVIAPDLRGHGQSDAPYTSYTMPELVSDLQTIVEELNIQGKFILVGHSFGGSICVEYANKYPERLDKLVLIATGGEYPLPRLARWAYRIPTAFYRLWWEYRPRWNAEIHVMKRMMFNNMRNWKGWPLLRNITTDTLLITGERDTYFPRYVFEEVAQMVPGAEVYNVGSAKHKVQLERRDAVNRAIERFINLQKSKESWRGPGSDQDLFRKRPWLTSYSPETPYTIPVPRRSLDKFLESAADWVPKRTATVFYGQKLTYKELNAKVNQFAHVLQGLGVQSGDRVLLVMPNSPIFIIAYYATIRIGGIVVLPNPDADSAQILDYARQTQSRILITIRSNADLARNLQTHSTVTTTIFAGIHDIIADSKYKDTVEPIPASDKEATYEIGLTMSRLMEDASIEPPETNIDYKGIAVIIFTSGTTEDPKGVCLTHADLVSNALQIRHWIPELQFGQETLLSVLPLSHSYGMTTCMNVAIALGATIVLLPGFERKQILDHIRKFKPTIFPGVPAIYTAINHAPNVRSYGLSSIKACISGAAPLPIEVQEEFEKLTRGRLVEGYGLTECSPITHANPLHGLRKVGSIGVPIPNTDAKIVDLTTGEDVQTGQIGELVIRGPQVMKGYWQADRQEAAHESVVKDGWLYTGDVAVMDEDGYFKLISRKRDTIMTGEYSVYPRDVEEVLYENSKVLEAAVVGVGKSSSDQKVKAFVVPRPNSSLSKQELIELCKRRLEPYAVPWEIEFREELPKSFVGKVLRRMLVEEKATER
jgi:long-chain acyl-CoA synthetase